MFITKTFKNLTIRSKILVIVLPMVLIPLLLMGGMIGYSSSNLAREGINQASREDLDHMATFTRHMLEAHHRQFQVYQQKRKDDFITELKTLVQMANNIVTTEYKLQLSGKLTQEQAQKLARKTLKKVSIGTSGYIYALTSDGVLQVHPASEQENIIEQHDKNGHYFIREMVNIATNSTAGTLHQIYYPWRNTDLGEMGYREKLATYLYFPAWDWIIAAAGYTSESYSNELFEQQSLQDLKDKIKSKQVGKTGYIFCMTSDGTFTLHPGDEGKNLYDIRDNNGHAFIKEMCDKKQGWIRYPWSNNTDGKSRMKIVRYIYFQPWDWIIGVGCYEDEFYQAANTISWNTMKVTCLATVLACLVCIILISYASKVLTNPIKHMTQVIRRVRSGHIHEQMQINSNDELGELTRTFNHMTEKLARNQEIEANLAQQGKMASLGVLSSGVAHEINNPLGVILGYAGYLENKTAEDDPNYNYIHEIKRESKRCRKIVQDLLGYARTPKSILELTDINTLLEQITDFAANHTDMHHVKITKKFTEKLPLLKIDGDQMRQVAINLILNSGGAIDEKGTVTIETKREDEHILLIFSDSGCGIEAEKLEKIFEPFYTTKEKGTGLGLAISRQIIEQHHGTITISSVIGTGTTVTVRLPIDYEDYLI
ncbi:MAG: histidine kinase [Desulfobacteraceae bacterium 4572_35.1]|nr:MAG: histidine kinase [Desulfobacteraceae bacterium 4572_35.1]